MLIKSSQAVKDKVAVKADVILSLMASKTPLEISQYFESNLSVLVNMTDAEIDAHVNNNINTVADVKGAIKLLAKDSAFHSSVLESLAKAVVLLSRSSQFNSNI